MSNYGEVVVRDGSRQHVGDVHGGQTNNYHIAHSDHEAQDALIIPQAELVRPIDARFDGDELAIAIWLKKNNLPVVKHKNYKCPSIIDLISPYSVRGTYGRLSARGLDGTVEWIAKAPKFLKWLSSKNSIELFLVGKVGSGKTTAMTTIMQTALRELPTDTPVLSFFFEHPMRSEVDLVSSLTQQLLRWMVARGRQLPSKVRLAIGQMYGENICKPTLDEIRTDIFEPIIPTFVKCAVIIDGIDNSDIVIGGPSSLIWSIRRLGKIVQLNVIISTRLQWSLPDDATVIALDSETVGGRSHSTDITFYVDTKLRPLSNAGQLLEDPRLHREVREELLAKAEGMFLWVTLQVEYLFGRLGVCSTAAEVKQRLGSFPNGLHDIYVQCLVRQPGPDARYTARVLAWICSAPQPTHLDHIRELLAFQLDDRHLDPADIPPANSVRRAAMDLVVLGKFLDNDEPDDEQYCFPAHPTVRDSVFSAKGFAALRSMCSLASSNLPLQAEWSLQHSLIDLGGRCAAYLIVFSGREIELRRNNIVHSSTPTAVLLDTVVGKSVAPAVGSFAKFDSKRLFTQRSSHTLPTRVRRTTGEVQVRLLGYARRNWHQCLRAVDPSSKHFRAFRELVLNHAEMKMQPWIPTGRMSQRARVDSLFFWALINEHCPLLDLAIAKAQREDLFPSTFWNSRHHSCGDMSVLHFAVKRCSTDVVARLLPSRHEVIDHRVGGTVLHMAVEKGDKELVKMLLEYSKAGQKPYATVYEKDGNGRSVLHLAIMQSDKDLCDLLLQEHNTRSTDLFIFDRDRRTPLFYANITENPGIITSLLRFGFVVEEVDFSLESPGTLVDSLAVVSKATRQHLLIEMTKRPTCTMQQLLKVVDMDEVYAWATGWNTLERDLVTARFDLIHRIAHGRGKMDPKVVLRMADDYNSAGKALLDRNLTALIGLCTLDPSYLTTHVRRALTGGFTPLELATRLKYLEGMEFCLPRVTTKIVWRARNLAAGYRQCSEFRLLNTHYLRLIGLAKERWESSASRHDAGLQDCRNARSLREGKNSRRLLPDQDQSGRSIEFTLTVQPCASEAVLVLTSDCVTWITTNASDEHTMSEFQAKDKFIPIKSHHVSSVKKEIELSIAVQRDACIINPTIRLDIIYDTNRKRTEPDAAKIDLRKRGLNFFYTRSPNDSSFQTVLAEAQWASGWAQLWSANVPERDARGCT
ncbi:Putative ankyrin repeat-containing domain superfamily [Septoria linicola]|uniref:Ankyrin repeat-containing domain superfamily n=1 Tax=Septoria linicola TaxID=215465 RepID=A0A9Q9EJH4_9PEZI|nr:putative ankyrin repeat-containing domain superfamily [Septoria linicola]USW52187.1 Putative ankyrin repeat-containing domain superfamily [Septoria linicola]